MKTWPIRIRLTFWYAACLSGMLILFGFLIHTLMAERLVSRTDTELKEEMQELLLEMKLASTHANLKQELQLRFQDHPQFQFDVQTLQGVVLLENPEMKFQKFPANLDHSISFSSVRTSDGEWKRVGEQLAAGPEGPVAIRVATALYGSVAELEDLRWLLFTMGPLVVLVSILCGYGLAVRFLRPLDSMVRTAQSITALKTHERLEVINPHDEIGRLAQTLNELIERLHRSFEEQIQFTADAAHELRTPLAVLRSIAELALRQTRTPAYYQKCLKTLVDEIERLTALSNQLLLLAREDTQLDERSQQTIGLSDLLETLKDDWEPIIFEKGLTLSTHLEKNVLTTGDADRLGRVFLNILDNAVKYTPAGGSIEIVLRRQGEYADLTVRDSGIGIAKEYLPHLFRRFYRVDSARVRSSGGAGLGLAIARSTIDSHGGTIEIRSDLNQGTTVHISLPLCPPGTVPSNPVKTQKIEISAADNRFPLQ